MGSDAADGDSSEGGAKEPRLTLDSRRSRVTVDFSGPPLALPDETGPEPAAAPEEPPSRPSLTLDDPSPGTDAIDLVDRTRPSEPELDLAAEMVERFALDDFTGALRVAQLVLGRRPDDPEARRIAEESERRLEQLYTARLGGLDRVPFVAVPETDIRWLGLDSRAAFLLSRVDGTHTLEELVHVSGMPRVDALKTLAELEGLGAIRLR